MDNRLSRGWLTRQGRRFFLLLALAACALVYYLGELVDYLHFTWAHSQLFYGIHDWQRLLFLIPICYAGYHYRLKGALLATLAALLICLPRALFLSPYPAPLLRMLLFIIAAGLVGALVAAVCNRREQSARREAIARAERARLLDILHGIVDGVCIVGPDYRLRFVNAALAAGLGPGAGRYCYEYLHGLEQPCAAGCHLAEVLQGAHKKWEYSCQDGRIFEVDAAPLRDPDGQTCQLTTLRDVTQPRHIASEALGLKGLRAESLANLFHELQSPLTTMRGVVSGLLQQDVEFSAKTREMLLAGMLEETVRLEHLVTNLLDMGKLEARVWAPAREWCSIFDVVGETAEGFRWTHPEHTFKTELPPGLPDVYADRGQIKQVLINLLDNASAYSGKGTTVTIGARGREKGVELFVADEGPGIPPEELKSIFRKYYRGSQGKGRRGGVGLGLTICKAIVQNHGGKIWVESAPGRGATFFFTLPVPDLNGVAGG